LATPALIRADHPQAAVQQSSAKTDHEARAIPELSLESLYHPEQKYEYVSSTPSTHWIDAAPSKLLMRREQQWNEVNLETHEERPWSVVEDLTQRLRQLDGLDDEQARRAVVSAVHQMKTSDDPILVNVEKSLAFVSPKEPARWLSRDAQSWRDTMLDPTGRRVAYTSNGDLFVLDVLSERSLQLTHDGSETMLNGILDWTYQEEIYGRGNYRGFWFSPDGMWMAMLRIDISGIAPYTLSSASSERGAGLVARYPKAGDPIPHAELYLWDLRGFEAGTVPPAKLLAKSTPEQPRIISGVWWHPKRSVLLFAVSDRLQSWRELRAIQADSSVGLLGETTPVLREESPTWIEPPVNPAWIEDSGFLWRSEIPSGRTRLYHVSSNGMVVTPMSPADFDVRDFYVQASQAQQPHGHGPQLIVTGDASTGTIEQQVYRVDHRPGVMAQLTPLTSEPGWHTADFSPDSMWFVDRFSAPSQPTELWLRSTGNQPPRLIAKSESKVPGSMISPEVFTIATEDGIHLPAMLIRPATATSGSPCPVVIEVYGGPSAPVVTKRFADTRALYRELLARNGIATLLVDNRSSAGAGLADTWKIHRRVGEQEFADVMSAVKWLRDQPWVDGQKIAIRGWSFGGFLTLYAMTHSDVFAAGIAGGSVTDWKEYDAFYTERYMGLPSENPNGYRDTAPIHRADQLHGRVLLIHGEADDNVHPSNTMRMAASLQEAGKEFELMIYPGAAHGIHDPKQVWHLNQTAHRFLLRQLLGK
jgi:dipeptidyl-peptidase-4